MAAGERVVRTSCRGCHGICQVLVHLDAAGRVVRVTGDPESPTSRGYICPKAQAAPEQLYHPERITRPLRRTGARGAGQWKAVSWDEALSEMAEVFARVKRESGAEYVALCQGTGRPYTEFTGRFIHAFGSPHYVGPGHNCFLPRNIAAAITLGWFPQPDIYGHGGRMPACVLEIGENLPDTGGGERREGRPAPATAARDGLRAGARPAARHHRRAVARQRVCRTPLRGLRRAGGARARLLAGVGGGDHAGAGRGHPGGGADVGHDAPGVRALGQRH